ncbi:MAG: hypothetical protein KFB93_06780 [Simkaniaceae bacterium]|nr:MAG: hypothetical protein KFB93_06780 [Simkaniaceae bacterium]
MTIRQIIRFNRIFFLANLALFIGIIAFFAVGAPFLIHSGGSIEANRIILKGESGMPNMILQGDDENTLMTFNDSRGNIRLQLQGGVFPALIMKNDSQEIVGTFFPLKDGGAAVGLGDREGNMATFIRGGSAPMMNFYHESNQPNIAMGIANELPHFVMIPKEGHEGVLIHGNAPASLLFIDENGEIPVSLSRYGLHQPSESKEETPSDEKVFSSDIQSFLKGVE